MKQDSIFPVVARLVLECKWSAGGSLDNDELTTGQYIHEITFVPNIYKVQ